MERPIHRYRRFKGWDYSRGASFFITLSLDERKPLFGQVHDGIVCLSELGREVLASLERIPVLEPAITLYGHVVMPDHVHFNCHLAARLEDPLEVLGRAIRSFKNHTTKFCKLLAEHGSAIIAPSSAHALQQPRSRPAQGVMTAEPSSAGEGSGGRGGPRLWRLGYHDHLCLSRRFIAATERYIAYNPLKWALMHGSGSLRIHEPLFSPRLDPADYWKGVGNPALLSADSKLVSLRVSRQVRDIASVVARMEQAADRGFTIMSGFVSAGEQAVRDALCRRPGARLVHVRASCIPNARFRPESAYVQAFAEGRCLELGRGNEEIAFGRAACLDVNAEIVEMAKSGPGYALYFTCEGLIRL